MISRLLKALKSLQAIKKNQKNREKQEKEGKRVKEKRTDVSFNRYIDSPLEIEKKNLNRSNFFNVFTNPSPII